MFEHVRAGQKFKPPKAVEYNAMLDAGRAQLAGNVGIDPGAVGLLSAQASTIKVINKTGGDRNRYEGVALGEPRWELDAKQNLKRILVEAEAADPAKPVAVLQHPLKEDRVGIAVIGGPTILRFDTFTGTGSGYAGVKDNHKFDIAGGPIRILKAVSDGYGMGIVGFVGSGLAVAPAEGIPARTGAGTSGDPYVFGSADCKAVNVHSGEVTTADLKIYNMVDVAIEAGLIQWKTLDGLPFVDVEQCPAEE